jgi:hypothetical protein
VVNMRVDDQMGLVMPYAKMGSGAKEGEGVLVEFLAPPGKGVVDFHTVITRYEQRMAMVGLAQFIHLGMNGVGARALGESGQDFFTLAVTGWVDAIADTINRFAVEPLMKLNYFPGLTAYPKLVHGPVSQTNLGQLADFINKLAGAELITPHPDMERALLELADMPASPDLDKRYAEKEKQAAEMAELSKQAALAPKPAPPGANVAQDGERPEQASWLEQEIDDVKVYEMLALMRQQGGGGSEALVAELRRANDLMALSLQAGGGQAGHQPFNLTLKEGEVHLPEGFGQQAPPVVNVTVDNSQMAQAIERFANQAPSGPVPQVHVTVPETVVHVAAPVVNVPAQPAPVVNVAAPNVVINPEIRFPETVETIEVQRDDAGLMQSATKRRKQKRD